MGPSLTAVITLGNDRRIPSAGIGRAAGGNAEAMVSKARIGSGIVYEMAGWSGEACGWVLWRGGSQMSRSCDVSGGRVFLTVGCLSGHVFFYLYLGGWAGEEGLIWVLNWGVGIE
jgi:hypothetical protein